MLKKQLNHGFPILDFHKGLVVLLVWIMLLLLLLFFQGLFSLYSNLGPWAMLVLVILLLSAIVLA